MTPMRERFRLGAPVLIMAGAALLIAGRWATGLHFIAADRAQVVAAAEREHANLAFTLGEQNTRALRNVETSLRNAAKAWRESGTLPDRPDGRLVRRLVLVDAQGRIALDNNEYLDASRQEFFTAHRDDRSAALHISPAIRSRITGELMIPVSIRVDDAGGAFAGVIVASLAPGYFSQLYGKPDLGARGSVMLLGTDGGVRARRESGGLRATTLRPDSTLLLQQRRQPQGHIVSRGLADGVRRYMSYYTLSEYPSLIIAVGREESDVLARHNESARIEYIFMGLGTAIILAFAGLACAAIGRQRRNVRALAASEARYRDIFEGAVEGIQRTTRDGRIVAVNPAMARLAGFDTAEEFLASCPDVRRIYRDPGIRELLMERLDRDGAVSDVEYELMRRDGSVIWVSLNARVVHDTAAGLTYYEGFHNDITARKREQELRAQGSQEALRRYRELLERLGVLAGALSEAADVAAIYRAVLAFARESAPVDGMYVSLLDAGQRARRWVHAWAAGREEDVSALPALPMDGGPHARAIATGCVVVTAEAPSCLVVPLQVMGRVIGGFEVRSDQPAAYREEHVVALQVAAPLVAMALENVRLLAEERAHRERVEQAERRNAAILDSAMDAIVTIDADDRLVDFNPSAEKLFGIPRSQALGRTVADLVLPAWLREEYVESLETCLREGRASGEGARLETTGMRGDGNLFAVEISVTRVPGSEPPLLTAFLRDITERQRAVLALRQSEARYRDAADELADVIDGSLDAICVLDRDGRFVRVSAACYLIWGRSPEDLVGQRYLDFVHPEDIERTRECGRQVMAGRATRDFENRNVRSDGTTAYVMWSARWRHEEGTMLCVARDVTNGKLMAEANRHLASRLHEALENLTSGFATVDAQWRVTYVNRAAEMTVGRTREAMVGGPLWEVVPGLAGSGFEEKYRRAMAERVTVEFEDYMPEIGRWFEVRAYPTTDGGLALYFHDVSERQRALSERRELERQLMRNQRIESLGTLAGGIAHDLNNVFTPIMMGLDLLEGEVSSAEATDIVGMVRTSAVRGADMVKQVLHFARGIEGERVEVEPRVLLEELERMIRETFPRNIDVHVRCEAGLPRVTGDPTQLHQVLLNLCVNARDAMPGGGTLTLRAREVRPRAPARAVNGEMPPGRYVALEVEDNGCGIAEAVLERIFDPFFTTKRQGEGTGLGLSTSLAIVRKHDGFVQVKSELTAGSRFDIFLPVQEARARAHPATPIANLARGAGETILLVDDEPGIRSLARRALDTAGYRVITAGNGAEALAAFRENPSVDLVVTDMMMPVMDGAALVRALGELAPGVPVICTSGFAPAVSGAGAAAARAAFIAKPYTPERLVAAVQKALARETTA